MLTSRIKRHAAQSARAVHRLTLIEASIVALADEDLLDLADIFASDTATPIREIASAEMTRRNISL